MRKRKTATLGTFDAAVLGYITTHPGVVMSELAATYPVESKTYGRQRAISSTIARLRRKGLVQDVAHRCKECGAAKTRGERNVPLYAMQQQQAAA